MQGETPLTVSARSSSGTARVGRGRLVAAAAAAVTVALVAAACGGSTTGGSSGGSTPAAGGAVPAKYDLKAAGCPSTVVLQTDWFPEADHGSQYELLGPNPSIDTGKKTVTGELVAHGGVDTGVKLQIRAGGPAIGYQPVSSQIYTDNSITLGYMGTDEQIANSKDHPTVAVLASLEKSPLIIQWSPDKHPDWKTIADIGKTDTKVLYYQGASYMDYLTGAGILKKSQVDGSYQGDPSNFVASGGEYAVQGYATNEPYVFSKEVRSWDKPMKYQLVADAGYDNYMQEIAVRPDKLAGLKPCLTKLVPIMQQAIVDFMGNPGPVTKLIVDLVSKYKSAAPYSQGAADYGVSTMKSEGIVSDGTTPAIGDFDTARVQKLIGILAPIYTSQGKPTKPGLTASELVDNSFLDTKISLTS